MPCPLCPLVFLSFSQHVSEFLQRIPSQLRLFPQIGCEEAVAIADGHEGGFQRVLQSLGATGRRCVCVFYTGELEKTFDGGRGDETGTTGGGDELQGHCQLWTCMGWEESLSYSDSDATTFSTLFGR